MSAFIYTLYTHIHWQTKSTYSVYIYIWYTKNMSIASPSYSIPHHIIMVSSKNHRLWSPGSSWEVVRWSECPRWRGPRYPPGRRMGKNMGQSVRNVLVGGWPTPLKIWVRQLGWWHSHISWKIIQMFQTTNQYIYVPFWIKTNGEPFPKPYVVTLNPGLVGQKTSQLWVSSGSQI